MILLFIFSMNLMKLRNLQIVRKIIFLMKKFNVRLFFNIKNLKVLGKCGIFISFFGGELRVFQLLRIQVNLISLFIQTVALIR